MVNNNNNGNKKILIIDDNEDIVNLFKIFLECNGYSVETFTYPFKAIFNFRKYEFNLILLDVRIPGIDGRTIYKKLKEIDENVIICLTTADHNYLKSLKSLIAIYIIVLYKPIFLKDLKNKIDSLLVNYTLLKN